MEGEQRACADIEYVNRRRVSRRENFLDTMGRHDRVGDLGRIDGALLSDAGGMNLDFVLEQVSDATTLQDFRHLLEKHRSARG